MKFIDQLEARWTGSDTMLCVGLDPNPARLPKTASGAAVPVYDFCRDIIDATADTVCAFKPQFAYFAAMRELDALERLTAYIHERHPGIPVILDAKRGDIGSTAPGLTRSKRSKCTGRTRSRFPPTWALIP